MKHWVLYRQFRLRSRDGQSGTTPQGCVDGAPELVAEVAASSATYDLHEKLNVYRDYGVREYLVWKVLEESIVWFVLKRGKYKALTPDASSRLKSEVFPGLWLDTASLVSGKPAQVLSVLQEGLASSAHAKFVEQLQQSRAKKS